jgi:hypothetical protein
MRKIGTLITLHIYTAGSMYIPKSESGYNVHSKNLNLGLFTGVTDPDPFYRKMGLDP